MRNMCVSAVLRPHVRSDDDIATMEKDFLLNMMVLLLLLMGEASLITGARVSEVNSQTVPIQSVKIYIEEDGDLHFGSLSSPHVTLEEIGGQLRAAVGARARGERLSVLIHYTAKTPAGFVHNVLRVAGRVSGTEPLLALSRYGALPCEEKEQSR